MVVDGTEEVDVSGDIGNGKAPECELRGSGMVASNVGWSGGTGLGGE
jgi:hypothetical protein